MAEYRQYCPVARASEILADRWTPLIVRELLAGSQHFNEIERGLPGISRSLLVSRLRHLEDRGVIQRHRLPGPNRIEYSLTEAGRDLQPVIERLGSMGCPVGVRRADESKSSIPPCSCGRCTSAWIARGFRQDERSSSSTSAAGADARLWLVLTPHEASVCLKPPGFDSDLTVHADLAFFYRVWLGSIDYACGDAVRRP